MLKALLFTWTSIMILSCANQKPDLDVNSVQFNPPLVINISQIQLPFKEKCNYFLNWDGQERVFQGKDTIWANVPASGASLVIKNQNKTARPILFNMDSKGCAIDSLILFDQACYIGVDTDYQPWLEITEDYFITWTDTTHYLVLIENEDLALKNEITLSSRIDTFISRQSYKLNEKGKFILQEVEEPFIP